MFIKNDLELVAFVSCNDVSVVFIEFNPDLLLFAVVWETIVKSEVLESPTLALRWHRDTTQQDRVNLQGERILSSILLPWKEAQSAFKH